MGTVTVYFVGLCTHLRQSSSGVVDHRVVLINAQRDRLVNGRLIEKHTARVRTIEKAIELNGATLRLNSISSAVSYQESFEECIPRLANYTTHELGPLAAPMATWENPDLVSAYFDAAGTFSAGRNKEGAAIAVLTVTTAGTPVLSIDPFVGVTRNEILDDDAWVVVENIDAGPPRGDHDFLLHYKMLMRVPPDADWPRVAPGNCTVIYVPTGYETVGPGCSNSTYP